MLHLRIHTELSDERSYWIKGIHLISIFQDFPLKTIIFHLKCFPQNLAQNYVAYVGQPHLYILLLANLKRLLNEC